MQDLELDNQRRTQLDANIRKMLEGGATKDDVMKYASDFKNQFGLKKKVGVVKSLTTSSPTPSQGEIKITGGLTPLQPVKKGIEEVRPTAKGIINEDAIDQAIQQDKLRQNSYGAALWNSAVGSLQRLGSGGARLFYQNQPQMAKMLTGYLSKKPVNEWDNITEEDVANATKQTVGAVRSTASSKEYEKKIQEGFDVTNGFGFDDLKALGLMIPQMAADMGLGAATMGGSMFVQGYDDALTALDEVDTEGKVDQGTRALFGLGGGIVVGLLEKAGFDNILKVPAIKKQVIGKIIDEATEELVKKGVKIGAKEFEEAVTQKAQSFAKKEAAKRIISGSLRAGGIEAATETGQEMSMDALKMALNRVEGSQIFDEQEMMDDAASRYLNSFVAGGFLGGAGGGGITAMTNTKTAVEESLKKAKTPQEFDKVIVKINENIDKGLISDVEAKEIAPIVEKYSNPETRSKADEKVVVEETPKGNKFEQGQDGKFTAYKKGEAIVDESGAPIKFDTIEEAKEAVRLSETKPKGEPEQISQPIELSIDETTQTAEVPVKTEAKVGEPKTTTETIGTTEVTEAEPIQEKGISQKGIERAEAKKIYKKVNETDIPKDAEGIALSYLAGGGKVSEAAINEVAGRVKRARLNTGERELKTEEAKARDYYQKEGKSLDDIAHELWESSNQEVPEQDIKNALMDAIANNNTRLDAAKQFLERYNPEYAQDQYYEQLYEQKKAEVEAEEAEINKWLAEEGEREMELAADEEYINQLIKKYETDLETEIEQPTTESQRTSSEKVSSEESGAETEPKPTKARAGVEKKKISEESKKLADKVRSLKIDLSKLSGGGLQSNPLGLPVAVWNGAMDIVAKVIEEGGNVADAIKRGLNYIQKNHRGQWNKKQFNDEVLKELGVRGITVNGEDLIVKDDSKTVREFAETVNGFYSDIEQYVFDVNKNSLTAKEWLGVIGSGDEAKFTGVRQWLESKKPNETVAKSEIQKWMKDNKIEIVEVVKGFDTNIRGEEIKKEFEKNGYEIYRDSEGEITVVDENDELIDDIESDLPENLYKLAQEYYNLQSDNSTTVTATKFSQYQLEGEKENYKEILVTMPVSKSKQEYIVEQDYRTPNTFYAVNKKTGVKLKFGSYELAKSQAERLSKEAQPDFDKQFKSSHFEEPNILVHLRMNTRTDAEGNKVLFLEEVQSDWGQKGKKEGFRNDADEKEAKQIKLDIKELSEKWEKIAYPNKAKFKDYKQQLEKKYGGQVSNKNLTEHEFDNLYDLKEAANREDFIPKSNEEQLRRIEEKIGEKEARLNKLQSGLSNIESAPFVTDTNAWTKLGLKVALKEAIKQDAKKIAWTTGEQQNERYDLSKQVDQISYRKNSDGNYYLSATKGGNNVFSETNVPESKLSDFFGKDVAERIVNKEGNNGQAGSKILKGEQLSVGGKGMKGFYGSPSEGKLGIVGEVARSLFKQEPKKVSIELEKKGIPQESIDANWVLDNGNKLSETQKDNYEFNEREWVYTIDNYKAYRLRDSNDIKEANEVWVLPKENRGDLSTQYSIDITPELKAEVEGGLPLFKDIKGRGKEIADLLRKGKIKIGGLQSNIAGIPIAIYNSAIEVIATALENGASLTQAINKAIKRYRLNENKNFNQSEFIKKLEDATGEKFTDAAVEPPKPPKEAEGEGKESFKTDNKSILNRIYQSENITPSVKEKFKDKLRYKVSSQEEARSIAKEILKEYSIEEAVTLAEAGKFDGDVNSFIFAEALDRTFQAEVDAKTAQEKAAFAEKWADIAMRYDESARDKGRFIAAIADFYRKSPLGIKIAEEARRSEEFKKWFRNKEDGYKEVYEEIVADPEFKDYVKEEVQKELKKERAEYRKEKRKKIEDTFDGFKINKDALYAIPIPPNLYNAAVEAMKQAFLAGESIANAVEVAVEKISSEIKDWDRDKFRKEYQERLTKIDAGKKSKLTSEELTEEKRQKLLDKFRNKLKGLSEKEKDEVIRKAFKKLVENGALEYDDFKQIIAETIGLGELTAEETQRITQLVKDINDVETLANQIRQEDARSIENLRKYQEAKKKAEKSATELGQLVYNKPNVWRRFLSIMQLSTLGFPSLVNNPIFNIANQAVVRFPIGVQLSVLDQILYGASKVTNRVFGTGLLLPQNNVALSQKEFVKKLWQGSKQSTEQLFTGLTNRDYFQKEVYSSQIHPFTSAKELWDYSFKGKKLTPTQVTDKAIQATVGTPAEVVARLLNIGDKPQRYAAEGAQAATFAKNLGLKDIVDYEYFLEFPKEEAFRKFKQQGLSDESAMKKAEEIRDGIVKQGEESVFQQDNFLNDVINQAFKAADRYGTVAGNISETIKKFNFPFLKIPLNAFWSYYNLANPMVALTQSAVYAAKAIKTKSPIDIQQSKKWAAHATTGMALMAIAGALAKEGIVNSDNDDETTKKERMGEQQYEQQKAINITKLRAYLNGQDPNKVENGLNIDLKWLGVMGNLLNIQANKLEEMTPEQKENGMSYMEDMLNTMTTSGLELIDNGVFSNASGLLTAINKGGGFADQYFLNLINMGTNIIQPAMFAQISRAQLPYYSQQKADDFYGQLQNSMLARSAMLRTLTGKYPPSKIGIWGDQMDRSDNVLMKLFSISKSKKDNFAQPIYDDYKRTGNTKFFPPSVMPTINKQKLSTNEAREFEILVGQSRKKLISPYIHDGAILSGFGKVYSKLKDEDKIKALEIIYEQGFEDAKEDFLKLHPQYKKDESIESKIRKRKESRQSRIFRSILD